MSIYISPSKLLKNHTKYNHDLNTFYVFSNKNITDKGKFHNNNNNKNPPIGNEHFQKRLEKINGFNPSISLKETNKANFSKPKKILFSNYSINDHNSNNYKSFNSDALSNKQNESLTLIIKSNKNLSNNINNNNNNNINKKNKDINTDLNFNIINNATNNNFEIGGGKKFRKSKSSERTKPLDSLSNKGNIYASSRIDNFINHNYEPIQYTKFSSLKSKHFAFKDSLKPSIFINKNNNDCKINDIYKTNQNWDKNKLNIDENRDIHTSRSLNHRSNGFSSKASLHIRTKKFMIKKNKLLQKALTAKSTVDNNSEFNKESEKTLNCHHKKSVINKYFEKKESERHMFLNNDKNKNEKRDRTESELNNIKRLNSAPEEAPRKGFFLTSTRVKPKEKEDGFFMLKKDYFIQTLFEKNTNANYQNFIEELNQSKAQAVVFENEKFKKHKNINFNKIKIENEFENINVSNTNNNKLKTFNSNINNNTNFNCASNFFATSINTNFANKCSLESKSKYRLKSSKNCIVNESSLLGQKKTLNPKTFDDTMCIRNFSNFKLRVGKKQYEEKINLRIKGHRKELSAGAYSQNSSNYMHFDNISSKGRNCRSALRLNNFNSGHSSFTKENQTKPLRSSKGCKYKDNFNENDYNELNELRNSSGENEPKNASVIISRNNNFNLHSNHKENINNSNPNVFYFDKASKLNYYHARELSAFSRERRRKADELRDLNNSQSLFKKKKGFQTTLNLKILNFNNGEITKKPLLTIRPYNFDDKLFSNDYIKGNMIKDKEMLYRGNSNNNDNANDLNNERLTIETLQERSKEVDEEVESTKINPEKDYNQIKYEDENDKCTIINQDSKQKINLVNKSVSISKEKGTARKRNIPKNPSPDKSIKKYEARVNNNNRKDLKITKAGNENNDNNLTPTNAQNAEGSIGQSNFHRIKKISINKNRLSSAMEIDKDNLRSEDFKNTNQFSKGKEHFKTKKHIDNLYEMLSANNKLRKSNGVEYVNASNSLTKHMNNKLINPNNSTGNNDDNNTDKNTRNSKSRNKNNSKDKSCSNINIKEEEIIQSNRENNKEKEVLKEFLKGNVYLDSDHFNFSSTNENLRKEDKDKIISYSNKKNNKYKQNKTNQNIMNYNNNYYTNNVQRKKSAKVDRGFQSDFDYVTNRNLQNLRRLKIQSANKLQSRNPFLSYDELKKINLNDFDLNEYLYSQNIDYQKINNYNFGSNKRTVPKSAIGFSNKRSDSNIGYSTNANKPPPHSFRNVFTSGKIKLSTMILSNVKL